MTTTDRFTQLVTDVSAFAAEREWEQFHTPKNLVMALAGEVGELIAEFQWLGQDESRLNPADDRLRAVREEMADVLIYLIRLSTVLEVDLIDAATDKLVLNEKRYPVELSRGNSDHPQSS